MSSTSFMLRVISLAWNIFKYVSYISKWKSNLKCTYAIIFIDTINDKHSVTGSQKRPEPSVWMITIAIPNAIRKGDCENAMEPPEPIDPTIGFDIPVPFEPPTSIHSPLIVCWPESTKRFWRSIDAGERISNAGAPSGRWATCRVLNSVIPCIASSSELTFQSELTNDGNVPGRLKVAPIVEVEFVELII